MMTRDPAHEVPDRAKALITAKLLARELPGERPALVSARRATGADLCSGCDELIDDIDVRCTLDAAPQDAMHFHADCFTEWRRQQVA
jgi:hypothetical protein